MDFPIPEAQYWDISKQSDKERQVVRKFVPEGINLSVVDVGQIYKIDTFYLECQKYRDHYRDPYGKVHCPNFFKLHKGKCGIKLDRTLAQMTLAITRNVDRQPIVFPLIRDYGMVVGRSFPMGPTNSKSAASSFKR